jgi:hypothetical protein
MPSKLALWQGTTRVYADPRRLLQRLGVLPFLVCNSGESRGVLRLPEGSHGGLHGRAPNICSSCSVSSFSPLRACLALRDNEAR